MNNACASCRFWEQHMPTALFGYCRRFPPQPSDDDRDGWPETKKDDWCGEFLHRVFPLCKPAQPGVN